MSVRLTVRISATQLARARACASASGIDLSEWVRRAMATSATDQLNGASAARVQELRRFSTIPTDERGPAPRIEQMLNEINSRYEGEVKG